MLDFLGKGIGMFMDMQSAERNRDLQERNAANNIALQREFAQSGIQWKVEDAKKAGIHPLYALGASTTSFSPVSVGASAPTSFARDLGSMGQDISRAVNATRTGDQRVDAYSTAAAQLSLEKAGLENELLRANINKIRQQINPPLPSPGGNFIPGQGDTPPIIKVKPGETETSSPYNPSQAAVVAPDVAFSQTRTGMAPVPSKTLKEQIEDITIPQLMWGIRNNVLPIVGINQNPPQRSPGEGNVWVFHPVLGEYQAVPRNSAWAKAFGRFNEVWR